MTGALEVRSDWQGLEPARVANAPTDPFVELSASASEMMASAGGVRCCGTLAMRSGRLLGASHGFYDLPSSVRAELIDAVTGTIGTTVGESHHVVHPAFSSSGTATGTLHVLAFPQNDAAVFAFALDGQALDLAALRRAAVSAMPLLYQIDDLAAERESIHQTNTLLRHVEALADVGGWELAVGSDKLIWSDKVYNIHGLELGGEVTLESALRLYPSPGKEKLVIAMERAAAQGTGFEVTTPIQTPAGDWRIVRTVGRSGMTDGRRILYGVTEDVTARMSVERRLWWAANHDPVTSLPNRLLFEDRLSVAIQRSQRDRSAFALAVVEVSDFASLNPHSGYAMPDRNMLDVAGRLDALTRDSDTVARLSINEFALVLNGVSSEEQLRPEVDRMTAQIADLQSSANGGDGIVVSVGVAFFPIHATTMEELVRAAELALAQAKRRLDNPVIIYNRKIANDAERKRETVLTRARASLARNEFVPFYQPQIDIETNQIVGVEALVRWQTSDTILDAKDFAYALDDHEIGGRVGRAVLDQVIADLGKLRQMTDRPFRVSINASRTEVLRNDFLDTFLEKARAGHLRPSDFIIEITEDVIIGVDDRTLHDKISFLVSSGVEFSLDDFGTGYASLIHITSFPVAEIKIDKQFITGIESDFRKKSIVRGIVDIARSMGLNLIAEGVETPEQQETLRDIGCRYVQGYLYSFPVPFAQFSAMLQEQQ